MGVHRRKINKPVFFLHHITPHFCERRIDKNFSLKRTLECENLCKIHWSVVFNEKFIVSPADHRLAKLNLLNGM